MKKFLWFKNFFVVPTIFPKIEIPGFYMHTDISRSAMIFEVKISLYEVAKPINSETINPQWPNSKIINTSQLNYPLSF